MMQRKDARSLLLSCVLGDGCLHNDRRLNQGKFNMTHSHKQEDYLVWKAELLNKAFGSDCKVRPCKGGTAAQFQLSNNRFKAWHKFCYTSGVKEISKILRFIRHPELAVAIWLMDDGYVEPSINYKKPEKPLYGARLRLFTCSFPIDRQKEIISWFEENFDISPKVKFQKRSKHHYVKTGQDYPFLQFNAADSMKLWKVIRSLPLQFPSMQHKFRHMETIYQRREAQRETPKQGDDIVGAYRK